MRPSNFASANVDEIVEQLTTDEAILLTAGVGFWHTHGVPRLGIQVIKVSEWPEWHQGGTISSWAPLQRFSPSGRAWREAKFRATPVILAPTCKIQRNPLGGWKDGTETTIKHFIFNDKENDRMGYDSIPSEGVLRGIYFIPFMLVQQHAKPWCFMASYNRVNRTRASENRHLLQDILRNEWKFDAANKSDWFGIYSIDLSINAGLDLEMLGTNK
ncbi:glycoside hydrolase [Imleria badia]|nr:glycoside hydrolase [Imleria badia]